MGIHRLEVRGDSNLAISQINGDFDAKDPKMVAKDPKMVAKDPKIVMPYSKYQLGSRDSNSTMWLEKKIKLRTSSPASAPSATLSHLIYSWKGCSSHP